MPLYITVADVRRASGVPSTLIDDTAVSAAIDVVEGEARNWLGTDFVPRERIDIQDGSGREFFFTDKTPLLSVRELKIDENTVDVSTLHVYKESGEIRLSEDSDKSIFINKVRSTAVRYLYGWMEESLDITTSTAAVTAGTSVVIPVTDAPAALFTALDFVELYGIDGFREVAQVTSVNDGGLTVTVDLLNFDHVTASILVQLQTPQIIKRFMEIEASIYLAISAIGSTFTFNASYSLGELSVVKGVPYLHWINSVEKLLKEREQIRKKLMPRPAILVM